MFYQAGCIECGVSSYPIKVCETLEEAKECAENIRHLGRSGEAMQTQTESVILINDRKQKLRIHRVENTNTFCIGMEDAEDHFEFAPGDAQEITNAINVVVAPFTKTEIA